MSEPENFLERWSRRKQQASVQPAQAPEAKAEKDEASAAVPAAPAETSEPEPAAFDIAELPSIESIGADTDVRGFLQPGVPPDLTRAALRRAWSSDPAIRDFVGLVENGWDFNDPNAMGGFGPIGADEAARLLAQATGELPELAKKMLAELPEESAPAEGQEQLEQPAVSSQPVRSMIDESGAPRESDDVRRNIDVVKNDASQEESDG
jgi:hypothetical protein